MKRLMVLLGMFLALTACSFLSLGNATPNAEATRQKLRLAVGATFTAEAKLATPTPDTTSVLADGKGAYATLKEAVEQAPDGKTISLGAGTFRLNEPLTEHGLEAGFLGLGADPVRTAFQNIITASHETHGRHITG